MPGHLWTLWKTKPLGALLLSCENAQEQAKMKGWRKSSGILRKVVRKEVTHGQRSERREGSIAGGRNSKLQVPSKERLVKAGA